MIDPSVFREAMARFAGAVTAITTKEDGARHGLIATSVCSLSSDPPTLLACINRSASAHDAILRQRLFGVSLPSRSQADVADHFAQSKGKERFSNASWIELTTGAPILADAAVAFDCRLVTHHDAFSHSILVGLVERVAFGDEENDHCLLWHRRAFAEILSQGNRMRA